MNIQKNKRRFIFGCKKFVLYFCFTFVACGLMGVGGIAGVFSAMISSLLLATKDSIEVNIEFPPKVFTKKAFILWLIEVTGVFLIVILIFWLNK